MLHCFYSKHAPVSFAVLYVPWFIEMSLVKKWSSTWHLLCSSLRLCMEALTPFLYRARHSVLFLTFERRYDQAFRTRMAPFSQFLCFAGTGELYLICDSWRHTRTYGPRCRLIFGLFLCASFEVLHNAQDAGLSSMEGCSGHGPFMEASYTLLFGEGHIASSLIKACSSLGLPMWACFQLLCIAGSEESSLTCPYRRNDGSFGLRCGVNESTLEPSAVA